MTNAERVEHFNKEIIGIDRKPGPIVDDKEFDFFVGSIIEELTELKTAREKCDFIGQLDAVTDLIFFAYGAFTRMGIPSDVSESIFEAVFDANMAKQKGKKDRAFTHDLDAVKPGGWKGPEDSIMEILSDRFGDLG